MRRDRWGVPGPTFLEAEGSVRVRFQEVDALQVVWHGHYLGYFEEGRHAFGRAHGFEYQEAEMADTVSIELFGELPLDFHHTHSYGQLNTFDWRG